MDKSRICFIRGKEYFRGNKHGDYIFEGIKDMGYQIVLPYKDYNLLLRSIREVWFRLHLPGRRLWYNPELKKVDADVIIFKDSNMIPDLFTWVKEYHPNARFVVDYDNRVCTTLDPNTIPIDIEKWSYDPDDCKEYGMIRKVGGFFDIYRIRELEEPVYDVLYLGRDKGRAKTLFELEDKFKSMGLKTYFHITADHRYLFWKHSYYKPMMPYTDYLELEKRSRAILNIMPEGQRAITQREMETIYNNVKCITNNKYLLEWELYHPDRFFILGVDDIETLPDFLSRPCPPAPEEVLYKASYDYGMEMMIDGKHE